MLQWSPSTRERATVQIAEPSGNITTGHSWQSPCQDCLEQAKIILEEVLSEFQCGFRAGRPTADMIFTLRQLQEKGAEKHQPLYVVFVDFTKAFDTVDRTILRRVLETYGYPDKLINIIKQFHYGMKAQVSVSSKPSDAFVVNHSVKRGCVLAPTLFSLYLTAVLDTMNEGLDKGVFLRTKTDGKLFNLAQISAHTKTQEICIRELLYADDSALVASNATDLQQIVDRFSFAADMFDLKSCSISLLQRPLNCQRRLRSWMNH